MVRPTARKWLSLFAFLCGLSLTAAASAGAATSTTAPGVIAHVPIVLTAAKIAIPRDRFVRKAQPNVARYPRGAEIDFGIKNAGSKRAVLVLRLTSKLNFFGASKLKKLVATRPIAPGKTTHLRASFFFRARFEFQLLVGGKVVARHPMVIF